MKTRLSYTVRLSKAPGESEATPVPVLVNRRPPVSLTKVVENAIDRGLIVGPKASAAEEIARGIADQTYREFLDGNGVAFGQYFYGRIYLDGTVGDNGTLTKANGVNVRLYKGEEFRLGLDDFSFSFEGADSQPKIDWLLATGQGDASVRNVLIAGSPVSVQGTFLNLDGDESRVEFREVGGAQTVAVEEFTSAGPDVLTFPWPAALVAGKAYEVTALRTQEDGTMRTSNKKRVTVKAGATPPVVNPPLIESVESQNEPEDTVNLGGAYLFVYGDNLDTATEVKVYNSHDEVVATVPVTFVPAGEMIPARLESTSQVAVEYTPEGGSENGKVEVTTAGGTNAKTVTLVSH